MPERRISQFRAIKRFFTLLHPVQKAKRARALSSYRYLANDQSERLRKYIKNKADLARLRWVFRPTIDEFIIKLLANTVSRAPKLCRLNIADLPTVYGGKDVRIRNGKGKLSRVIDIPDKLCKQLDRFVKIYRKNEKSNDASLVNECGRRISYRNIYARVNNIWQRAGIGKLHSHMLQHTYLKHLYDVEKYPRFV